MIKNWNNFKESIGGAISGTELFGKVGPNYGEEKLPTTLSNKDTNVCMGMDGVFYTESDYVELYNQSLKEYSIDPYLRSFNQENLDTLLQIISKN
jgi:hypothetical protein